MSKKKSEKKPGVLFYTDWLSVLETLALDEVGNLLIGALRYTETGELPDFEDRYTHGIWEMIRKTFDDDTQRYAEKCADGRYAAYCRHCKEERSNPLDRDDWSEQIDSQRPSTTATTATTATTVNERYQYNREQLNGIDSKSEESRTLEGKRKYLEGGSGETSNFFPDFGEGEQRRKNMIEYLKSKESDYSDWG